VRRVGGLGPCVLALGPGEINHKSPRFASPRHSLHFVLSPAQRSLLAATMRAALTAGAASLLLRADQSSAVVFEAIAAVESTTNSDIRGTVRFSQVFGSPCVHVRANILDLPDGEHGFHVHQYGDLTSTTDLSSLGAHFVP
jgi:Cu/Zn superoxide dismutase